MVPPLPPEPTMPPEPEPPRPPPPVIPPAAPPLPPADPSGAEPRGVLPPQAGTPNNAKAAIDNLAHIVMVPLAPSSRFARARFGRSCSKRHSSAMRTGRGDFASWTIVLASNDPGYRSTSCLRVAYTLRCRRSPSRSAREVSHPRDDRFAIDSYGNRARPTNVRGLMNRAVLHRDLA